ncbi:alkaline phosphatase family protein [Ralstonia insidiosa]|uniref:Phosphodiesterase n=1 Tax=Ralstonia insidiosa TaxID=190721 RepID=A0A191ZYT4_9RALS|nr:alkaline phosphatase family protein [Ralstonia insidiosa]ANJ73227.1 phosphodiesterase [Ralstonia insidiosa]KAB0473597.1 alkaline phosphatase family protein [Ralstonia insidiosa]MBY4911313.1 alkaline phosphatase family protein [Ralstonia insidiosa]
MSPKKYLALAVLSTLACGLSAHVYADDDDAHDVRQAHAKHVLLISVDGLHQSDLDWYVGNHPGSTLARLVHQGVSYRNARTPFPSDSFPGMVGQVTGGNPKTTGIYYDDAYSRSLLPAGTTAANCHTTKPGAEVFYAEVIAKDLNRLDSGQGIPGLYADLSKISQLTGHAQDLIDPAFLPVSPITCAPVYPHQYLKVNTVFEVARKHGLHTAWSDKHAAYEILNGPSGQGIDDLFAPEINSSVTDPSRPGGPGPDWTKDNTDTQRYDSFKVLAVLNWLKGHDHAGNGTPGVPAILGMNFQAVSTAQKLNKSAYYPDPSNTANKVKGGLGGYTNNGTVPGPVLQSALTFVDNKLGELVKATDPSNTVVIVSAKHGQSPNSRADLTIVNDGDMIDALNCAWEKYAATCKDATKPHLVAHAMDDDGILLWLNDRSPAALRFAKQFLLGYSGTGVGSDAAGNATAKPFTQAGASRFVIGEEVADFFGVKPSDDRFPDVVGIAQQGTVWAGSKLSKIAEHGGFRPENRHVPIVVWGAGIGSDVVDEHVDTNQIAPTILSVLGLKPHELQAVQIEGTKRLPHLH